MLENNKKASEIDRSVIVPIAKELFNIDSQVTDEEIQLGLDPVKNANSKSSQGGSAPEEVARQLDRLERLIEASEVRVVERTHQLADAKVETERLIQSLLARV